MYTVQECTTVTLHVGFLLLPYKLLIVETNSVDRLTHHIHGWYFMYHMFELKAQHWSMHAADS